MLFYCANVPCSYFHLHCDWPNMLGVCSAHKGDASDVYRNSPTECRASICFSAKNTNKIRKTVMQGRGEERKRGDVGKLVWVLPKNLAPICSGSQTVYVGYCKFS